MAQRLVARGEAEQVGRADGLENRLPRIGFDGVRPVAKAEFRQDVFHDLPGRHARARRRAAERRKVADRRALELGERMTAAHDHDELGRQELAEVQIRRRLEQAADGEIEIAGFEQAEQFGVEADVKLHLRGGALDDEARQERLADEPRHHMPGADAHLANLARRQLGDFAFGIVERDSRLVRHARAARRRSASARRRAARG